MSWIQQNLHIRPIAWTHSSHDIDNIPTGDLIGSTPFGRYSIRASGGQYNLTVFMDCYMDDGDNSNHLGSFEDCGEALLAADKDFRKKILECVI